MGKFLDRLSSTKSETVDLLNEAERAGCMPIASHANRTRVTVHGTLRSVTLRPVDGVSALEAELYDGSCGVTLIWLGRRKIEGITCGKQLTVEGRLGTRGQERVIYNPRYELDA
ncbi:OB-fold nucleic acid binding domain-containing protein [soil metagenome]